MKKITLLLFALFSCWQISAQVSSYAFNQTSGTYTEITGGTVLGVADNDDVNFNAIPIGFNFVFNATSYTQIGIQSNGWIAFGAVVTNYTPISSGAVGNVISALAGDLQGNAANGELSHQLSGTAPNQVLTIQWKNYKHFGTSGDGDVNNFQIKLYETTNVIAFVYGSFTQNATNRFREVGLRGAANTAFNNRTTTTNWSATTSGAVNTANCTLTTAITPSSGLTFTWTPPTCAGSTGLVTTDITTTTATITWTEPSSIPASGYEYILSSSAATPTGAGTASATNSAAITSLTQNTSYFVFVRSICGTDIGTWVLVGTFKTLCDEVTDFVQTFDSFTTVGAGILPDCWSKLGTSTGGNIVAGSVAPMSAPNRLLVNVATATTIFVVMPPVSNLQAATHRLRFKAYSTSTGKTLEVGYFTNPADLSTFVQLQSFAMPSTAATAQEFTLVPAALPIGVNQLVFTTANGAFTTIYVDDVKWEFNSLCVEPSQLSASSITNNSAQLGWVAGGATAWEIQYGLANFTLGTGTVVPSIATNPYTLSGLTANTTYQYYVRGVCEGPVNSSWAGPFTFKTQCNDATEFSENFDAPEQTTTINGPLPDCWTKGLVGNPTLDVQAGSVAPMSPIKRLRMAATAAGTSPTEAYAIMPPVSNLQANTHRLRFKAYATIANRTVSVGYMTDVSNTASFVELQQIALPGTAATTAIEFIVIPGALPVGVKHLAIRNNGFFGTPLGATTAYFDDFSWEAIPTCIEPSGLTASAITNTTALLGWTEAATATAWEIQYGAPGFAIGTGTIVPAATNPFTLTALMPNTNYVYYIRAVCSVTVSSFWTGPFAFKTQCDDVTSFTENFDAASQSTVFNGPLPDCWAKGLVGTPTLYVTTNSVLPMSPAKRMIMTVSSTTTPAQAAYAILPSVSNLNAGTHRLRFKAFASAVDRFLELGYLTDPSDLTTWQYLTDFQVPGTVIANTQQFIYAPATTIPAGVKHLAILNPGFPGGFSTIYIDDVSWEAIPTCFEPSSVTLGSVLATTATLNWTAASPLPAEGYEYYVATASTNPDGTTVPTGSVGAGITTAALTALMPTTQYFVWVRSVCSTTDKSFWTPIVTFTTPCASFTPPYTEPFTTWASFPVNTPACWQRYQTGDQLTGPTGAVNTGNWNQDGYLNVGFTGAARILISGTAVRGWLVSPVFDLTAGNYQVKYKVGATQSGGTGPITSGPAPTFGTDDFVYVLMSTDGGATWTNLTTYNAANTPSHLGTTAVFNIPTVTLNSVKFAFYGTSGSVTEGQTIDFFIDDFEVQTIPLTAPVCSATVTAVPSASCGNEATVISWAAAAGADGYKLTIGTTAGGSDIFNNLEIGALTYAFVGALNTTYYYKVVPFNANGDATGCAEQTFTTVATGCYCISLPTSNDGLGITNVLLQATNFPTPDVFYFDHSATAIDVVQGTTANLQVTYATGFAYNTFVWIDFNDNFTFEASELVFSGVSTNANPTTYNASFAIPVDAALGAHKMRMSTGDANFNSFPNPCYSGSWGVTLDFTVNVQPGLSTGDFDNASFKYYPNPVTDILTVSYSNVISDVVVYNLLGQQMLTAKPNATQTQMDLSGLTAGTYMVKVTSDEVTKTVKVIKN